MDAYIFQAALLCADCACKSIESVRKHGLATSDMADSDVCPQGPYADGGGEADAPQNCDHCSVFLENPLTSAGYQYVRDQASDKTSHSSVISEWVSFYEIDEETS